MTLREKAKELGEERQALLKEEQEINAEIKAELEKARAEVDARFQPKIQDFTNRLEEWKGKQKAAFGVTEGETVNVHNVIDMVYRLLDERSTEA